MHVLYHVINIPQHRDSVAVAGVLSQGNKTSMSLIRVLSTHYCHCKTHLSLAVSTTDHILSASFGLSPINTDLVLFSPGGLSLTL